LKGFYRYKVSDLTPPFTYHFSATTTQNIYNRTYGGYIDKILNDNPNSWQAGQSFSINSTTSPYYGPINYRYPLFTYVDQYSQIISTSTYYIYKKTSQSSYGVVRNNCELQGYAWSQDFGWIKFNGTNYKVSTSVCPPAPPSVSSLNVLTNESGDYCAFKLQPTFSWKFIDTPDDEQTAYQVQIATDNNFSNIIYDSGKIISNSNTYRVSAPPNGLNYDTTYYWRVKVWDKTGLASDWASSSFKTLAEHPTIDFSWQYQGKDESGGFNVEFFNNSYMPSGTSTASWLWSFQDGNPSSSYDFEPKPWVTFNSSGEKKVSLTGTDKNGTTCTKSKTINIEFPKPKWKEILPKIFQ